MNEGTVAGVLIRVCVFLLMLGICIWAICSTSVVSINTIRDKCIDAKIRRMRRKRSKP